MLRCSVRLGLVGVVFLWGAVGYALEPHIAQPPTSAGVAEDRPPPKGQADREAADDERQVEQPSAPSPAAEDSEDAESREAKERRAEEREQADLDAQRRMAESAGEMLRPAWWQVWLAGIGGALLAGSVGLSALATRYAAKAAHAAEKVLQAERAWLTYDYYQIPIEGINVFDNDGKRLGNGVAFRLKIVNSGNTPALRAFPQTEYKVIGVDDEAPVFEEPPARKGGNAVVGPSQPVFAGPAIVDDKDFAEFCAGRRKIILYSHIVYFDIFNPKLPRISQACICVTLREEPALRKAGEILMNFTPVGDQNTAT